MWVIFALLDPDPDSEYGSGSTDPIESGSATLIYIFLLSHLGLEVSVTVLDQLLEESHKDNVRRNAVADKFVQSPSNLCSSTIVIWNFISLLID